MINGNIITLNKDIATVLNKEEGRKITLSEFKKFIKEFYDEAFPVTLSRFQFIKMLHNYIYLK